MTELNENIHPTNNTDLENQPIFSEEMSENVDNIKIESEKSTAMSDKFNSNSHGNLCLARGIFYLIVTGCGFIDFELEQETGLITLLVSTLVIIIITFSIFLRDIKDPHDLTVSGTIFYIFFLLYFLIVTHTNYVPEDLCYAFIVPSALDLFCAILYKC